MPQLTLWFLRLPPVIGLLIGGYFIAASDSARGYLLIAFTAICWWAVDAITPAALASALARARSYACAIPSSLTLIVAISFAAAGIALYLESLLVL